VASTGVQVFIESHSEHILNSLRVGIKCKELEPSDFCIFYFGQQEIFKPKVDADGRIDDWPDGFFDEWDNNLMQLL
jgi:predicted ATPase